MAQVKCGVKGGVTLAHLVLNSTDIGVEGLLYQAAIAGKLR